MKSKKNRINEVGDEVTFTTSWDDFNGQDEKLLNLLYEYRIPATIYIPYNEVIEPHKLKMAKWAAELFEIGSHSVNHKILTKIPEAEMYAELVDSKGLLEEALGYPIKSFCYPRGRYNDNVIRSLKDAGYEEARTVDVGHIEHPTDPFRTKTTVHAFNGRKEYKGKSWYEYGEKKLKQVLASGGYFHLWGHSWEVEKYNQWTELESFLKKLNKAIYENTSS